MPLHVLRTVTHGSLIFCLVLYCLHGATYYWTLFQFLIYRRAGLAAERRVLTLPLPADEDLPDVLVQLPTFNEGKLIARIAEAVRKFEWPRHRLHIQILDDSTDGSTAFAEQAAESLCSTGLDAMLVHRDTRAGFKAGALADGLCRSDAPYIAIFDADYIPSTDFLRRCMRPLLHDSELALVQARCDYLNADKNWITFTQQRLLDAHFALEQPARCWGGELMPFNGTCGIWRREAIEKAGGWQGDTLAEDMDVSYRAQLKGWRTLILVSVPVPGELPESFAAWKEQQSRWVKGSAEVGRKMWPAVWRSGLAFKQKMGSTVHFSGAWFGPLLPVTAALSAIDLAAGPGLTPVVTGLLAFVFIGVIVGPAALQLTAQVTTRDAKLGWELWRLPIVTALRLAAGLVSLEGTLQALWGGKTPFVRTPKSASN